MTFETWAHEDPHRKRWEERAYDIKVNQRHMCKEHKVPLGMLLPSPILQHNVVLEYLPSHDLSKELVRHTQIVKDMLMMKVPQPVNGIEILKKMCGNNVVVLRAVDPTYVDQLTINDKDGNDRLDLLAADFGVSRLIDRRHDS